MKKLLYIAALCVVSSAAAVVDENFDLQNIGQRLFQLQTEASFWQIVGLIRTLQDSFAIKEATLDQIKEAMNIQFEHLKTTSAEQSEQEAAMHQYALELFNQAVAEVAKVTRGNKLPAIDEKLVKKGVDVQAARIKVIELFEAFLK